jgi:hypothetical protein
MDRWGLPPLNRPQVHTQVRLRLTFASDPTLNRMGQAFKDLGRHRNRANYDLRPDALFATGVAATSNVQLAADAITLLDAIDADPARRAAAVAAIRP